MSQQLVAWLSKTNPKAITGIGIGWALETQTNGAASVAGNIEIVTASTNWARVFVHNVKFFVSAFRIKVVQNNFPNAATHEIGRASCRERV